MRIVINIPEGFRDDEIVINIGREDALPVEPEEAEEELTPAEAAKLNAMMNYYAENMYGEVEAEEIAEEIDFGGDIEVG